MGRPRVRGGMVSKSASQPTPKRSTRTRVNVNRRSVQHHVAMWENAARDHQAGPFPGQQAGQAQRDQLVGRRMEVDEEQVTGQQVSQEVSQQVHLDGDEDMDERQEHVITSEGEQMLLADRLNPEVPPPINTLEEDSDGWSAIDRGGDWNIFLCEFQVLEEVPAQHKGTWVWALGIVLQRIQAADTGKELDRALMWLCFLPQAG